MFKFVRHALVFSAVALLLALSGGWAIWASQGAEREKPVPVSLISDIANPEKFDGRRLRVIAIHASRDAEAQEMPHHVNEDKNSDAAKLLALSNEWTDAINSRDRQRLDALMASDFALYHWNGALAAPRLKWLDNLFNRIKIRKNTLTGSAPQVYGDFGMVTSVADWIGTVDGKPFAQKCIVVDTWRKIDGHWKVVRRTSHCYSDDSVSGKVDWSF